MAELEATIDAMADGLVLISPTTTILRINPTAARLLGYTAEMLTGPITERLTQLHITTADGTPLPSQDHPALHALQGEVSQGVIVQDAISDAVAVAQLVVDKGKIPVLWDDLAWQGNFPAQSVILQWHYNGFFDWMHQTTTPMNPALEAARAGHPPSSPPPATTISIITMARVSPSASTNSSPSRQK